MIEEINELLKYMWNNDLSKAGKFNLEMEIRRLLNYKKAWGELKELAKTYNNTGTQYPIEKLEQKYNLDKEVKQ